FQWSPGAWIANQIGAVASSVQQNHLNPLRCLTKNKSVLNSQSARRNLLRILGEKLEVSFASFLEFGVVGPSVVQAEVMIIPGSDHGHFRAEALELGDFLLEAVLLGNGL